MFKVLQWLGKNKHITVLITVAVYFSIVTFHDEITVLAIRLRNAIGRDMYNDFLAYIFLAILLLIISLLFYRAYISRQRLLKMALIIITSAMTVFSFRFLMVYSIEAVHFVIYMLVAMLLMPVLRNYRETVFWVTLLGVLDELFQYLYLTPNFEYFDFNDITLNLIGTGAGALMIFVFNDNAVEIRRIKWYRSPAILTGLGLLTVFFILLMTGRMTINPVEISGSETWFSINRENMPHDFWTTAYPGRVFHILKPFEGIVVLIFLWAGFSLLDLISKRPGWEQL